jgi:hypothetical protein
MAWTSVLRLNFDSGVFCGLAANSRRLLCLDTSGTIWEIDDKKGADETSMRVPCFVSSLLLTSFEALLFGTGVGEQVHLGWRGRPDVTFTANGKDMETIVDFDYDEGTRLLAIATESRVQIFNSKNEVVDGFATDAVITGCAWTDRRRLLVAHGDEPFFLVGCSSSKGWIFEELDSLSKKFKFKFHGVRKWHGGIALLGKHKVYLMDRLCERLLETVVLPPDQANDVASESASSFKNRLAVQGKKLFFAQGANLFSFEITCQKR